MGSLIRDTGRDRYFEARERELRALLDPETGMLSARFARLVPCPLCGSESHSTLFVKQGFTFVRCDACRLVFSNPQVDEALVLEEYRAGGSNDLWVDVLTSERQLALDREKFGEILDELEPFRGGGRMLDVGCSIGLFLDLARERGWRGKGIEFGERALSHAREQLGLDVTDRPLVKAGFEPGSFDVVTLLSVLEHTTDPRSMVRDCARVLAPGGALYVIVPNVASLACRVLHERAATFDGRNHLVYFSPETLSDLLEREGFEPRVSRTRVTSLEPILEWLAYHEPYTDSDLGADPLAARLREPATRERLESLFGELGLGYKLHCLALRR